MKRCSPKRSVRLALCPPLAAPPLFRCPRRGGHAPSSSGGAATPRKSNAFAPEVATKTNGGARRRSAVGGRPRHFLPPTSERGDTLSKSDALYHEPLSPKDRQTVEWLLFSLRRDDIMQHPLYLSPQRSATSEELTTRVKRHKQSVFVLDEVLKDNHNLVCNLAVEMVHSYSDVHQSAKSKQKGRKGKEQGLPTEHDTSGVVGVLNTKFEALYDAFVADKMRGVVECLTGYLIGGDERSCGKMQGLLVDEWLGLPPYLATAMSRVQHFVDCEYDRIVVVSPYLYPKVYHTLTHSHLQYRIMCTTDAFWNTERSVC